LPSAFCRALGKGFAECHDGTWQRKVVMTAHDMLTDALPSARALGKEFLFF
jgi:hypothetical protein